MKLLGLGLAALATAAAGEGSGDFSEKCSYLSESECGTTAGCKWSAEWSVCQEPKVEADRCTPLSKTDCQEAAHCRYNREHGKPFFCEERDTRTKEPKPTKPTWDGVCSSLEKKDCKKNEACVHDRVSDSCCKVGDPCPDVGTDCPPLDKKNCKKTDGCTWNTKKEKCEVPTTCGYECSTKTDKCCKAAMKDKEVGRKDEDKCYLDRSSGTTKDARCVDHTECSQVTKKGWCKKFFKRAPWNCKWDKAKGECYEEPPYVEPETCEGKSAEDCAEHDECLSYDKEHGCRTPKEDSCDDKWTKKDCKKYKCEWVKDTKKCKKEDPYVEPATCEGKSKEDCDEHPECLTFSRKHGCRTPKADTCDDKWTKKDCKKFKCDWEKATKKCKKPPAEPETCEGRSKKGCEEAADRCLAYDKEAGCRTPKEDTCDDKWTKADCKKYKCDWVKETKKCKKGYEEPETCEGKSKEDCAKYPDKCLPFSKEEGCTTFTECAGLKPGHCKAMGCISFGDKESHECLSECPEGFSGDKCEIDDSKTCGKLSSSDADYDFTVVALRRVGDLGIVMDVSGSMATEIAGVKSGINAAASGCLDGADAPYKAGVVMEYSDPSTRFLGKGDTATFKSAVNRITRGMGKSEWGGDCPEVMFKGINDCMAHLDDWSTIYAITDASAKDAGLAAGTTATAKSRKIRINFILTATCVKWYEAPPFTGIHSVYPSTATGTGGQIYQITKSSSLGPKVTAVIAAAAHDALATTDVAYWEFSGSTNNINVDGYNHQTNFHISVVGASAGLSCTAENYDGAAIGGSDVHVLVNIDTVKTWSIPRISDGGRRLWRDSITCATSASASYTVTVRSGYEKCKKEWCESGGTCRHVEACGLFVCDCPAGRKGTYCEEEAPTTTTEAPTDPPTEAPTTAAETTEAVVTTEAPSWAAFKITKFDAPHTLNVLKNGINGWNTGEYRYYGFPDWLIGKAFLKSDKTIPPGTDIDIHYVPAETVGFVFFIMPDGTKLSGQSMGWLTSGSGSSRITEGTHLSKKYGFEKSDYKGIFYYNMASTKRPRTKVYRRIWRKALNGTGKLEFDPLTEVLSVSIAFRPIRLCPDCEAL